MIAQSFDCSIHARVIDCVDFDAAADRIEERDGELTPEVLAKLLEAAQDQARAVVT